VTQKTGSLPLTAHILKLPELICMISGIHQAVIGSCVCIGNILPSRSFFRLIFSVVFEIEGDRDNILTEIQQGVKRESDGQVVGEDLLAQSALVDYRL